MDKIIKKKRGLELYGFFNLKNGERKAKMFQKCQYLENENSFFK